MRNHFAFSVHHTVLERMTDQVQNIAVGFDSKLPRASFQCFAAFVIGLTMNVFLTMEIMLNNVLLYPVRTESILVLM